MKAKNYNGTIKVYSQLPKSYGSIIGGFDLLSNTQELGGIEWDSDNSRFTYPVSNKTFSDTLAEMKTAKIKSLKDIYNHKLSATDWIIVRDQELGNTTSQSVLDDRAALRTECSTKEAEINAKTTKAQVADYTLPSPI
jgi:hypothetical protein